MKQKIPEYRGSAETTPMKKVGLGILSLAAVFFMVISVQAATFDKTATKNQADTKINGSQSILIAGANMQLLDQSDIDAQLGQAVMNGDTNNDAWKVSSFLSGQKDNGQNLQGLAEHKTIIKKSIAGAVIIAESGNDIAFPYLGVSFIAGNENQDVILLNQIFAAEENLGGGLKIPMAALTSFVAPTSSDESGDGSSPGSNMVG